MLCSNTQSDGQGPALRSQLLQGTSVPWLYFDWKSCCVLLRSLFRSLLSPSCSLGSYTCSLSTQNQHSEGDSEGPPIQSHPWLHSEYRTSLDCKRFCFKTTRKNILRGYYPSAFVVNSRRQSRTFHSKGKQSFWDIGKQYCAFEFFLYHSNGEYAQVVTISPHCSLTKGTESMLTGRVGRPSHQKSPLGGSWFKKL